MTLYEIDNKLRETLDNLFAEEVDPETGEVIEGGICYDDIEELTMAREQKLENIGLYLKELDATLEAYKKEQERIKAKMDRIKKKSENLSSYVIFSMQGHDEKKFETPRVEMTVRQSEFIDVQCEVESLPEEYIKTKIEKSADKVALKKAIKSGAEIEGVQIGNRYSLTTK